MCFLACSSALDPSAATTCGEINYNKEKYEILSSILRNRTLETMCYIMKLEPSRVNKLDKAYKGAERLSRTICSRVISYSPTRTHVRDRCHPYAHYLHTNFHTITF